MKIFLASWANKISKRNVSLVALKPNKDLPYISKLFEDGKLKCVIDEKRFRLEDAREAMHYFGSGDHKGKVVISLK